MLCCVQGREADCREGSQDLRLQRQPRAGLQLISPTTTLQKERSVSWRTSFTVHLKGGTPGHYTDAGQAQARVYGSLVRFTLKQVINGMDS